ncbi:MAG: 16S rRNA (guanine(527)-N(7))-methyltransferase RsmG [Tissierellia bacterium]|nr:16S rRNA (guanine(527)-N(7))-methyltransferase RsmG [Tissierellia bacterium]MDD4725676.1 16S rRNA (guanine(527)-N(7))-methyltransferase RsmG [Tissierellia bacterium]
MSNIDTLVKGVRDLNINLDSNQEESFIRYKELLKKWNEKINITTITDDVEIDQKHFLDSLTPLTTSLFNGEKSLIDIGTGGGFPGIPLKIANPDLNVLLLDSLNKRIIFLNEVVKELGLKNIEALHGRAEELSCNPMYREKFDICISRAVAQLNTLGEYCMPFVKVGGHFISMKGPDVKEELGISKKAIKLLGGQLIDTVYIKIPQSDIVHSLIIIEKIRETPTKYPRGGGKPRKNPL